MLRGLLACIGLFSLVLIGSAQPVTESFDNYDAAINAGLGFSLESNEQGVLAWSESRIMSAYLNMYRATGNIDYLQSLITHGHNVIAQRNDYTNVEDFDGLKGAAWSSLRYSDSIPYSFIVHTGMITYPMIDFSVLIKNNTFLHQYISNNGNTFLEEAEFFAERVEESVQFHESQYDYSLRAYKFKTCNCIGNSSGRNLPYNMEMAMGRTLIKLYDYTNNISYLNKVRDMVFRFQDNVEYDASRDLYWWYYGYTWSGVEDISHATVDIDFLRLCNEYGIIVSDVDFENYTTAFTKGLAVEPSTYFNYINGQGGYTNINRVAPLWNSVSHRNKDIQHIATDYVFPILFDTIRAQYKSGLTLESLSFLALRNQNWQPSGLNNSAGQYSKWAGMVRGNFDSDVYDELAAIRNVDGRIVIYDGQSGELNASGSLNLNAPNRWGKLAAGDTDQDGIDELVAIDTVLNSVVLFYVSGTSLQLSSSQSQSSQFSDVGIGDITGDGNAEILVSNKNDGSIDIYRTHNGLLGYWKTEYPLNQASRWTAIEVIDTDQDGIDELIGVDDVSKKLYTFGFRSGSFSEYASIQLDPNSQTIYDIAIEDIDDDSIYEVVVIDESSFDLVTYEYSNLNFSYQETEYFSDVYGIQSIALGNFYPTSQSRISLAINRKTDGRILTFDYDAVMPPPLAASELVSLPYRQTGLEIYPNPVQDLLSVLFEPDSNQPIQASIYSIDGRQVLELPRFYPSEGANEWKIDVSKLLSGSYILSLTGGVQRSQIIIKY